MSSIVSCYGRYKNNYRTPKIVDIKYKDDFNLVHRYLCDVMI